MWEHLRKSCSLHIGLYSPALPDSGSPNGIVTYVRTQSAALRQLGHRVTVVSPDGIQRSDGQVYPTLQFNSLSAKLSRVARRFGPTRPHWNSGQTHLAQTFQCLHREEPFDVVEMEESFGWVGGLGLSVPTVVRLHGPHFLGKDDIETNIEFALSSHRIIDEGRGIAKADGITCPSPGLLATTLSHYGLTQPHAVSIYNPMPVLDIMDRWSIENTDPDMMLVVGRFDLRKGADIAIEAFSLVADKFPSLKLVMCGPDTGIAQVTGERLHFAEYIKNYVRPETRDRIQFLGPLKPFEVNQLRQRSRLGLSTSRFEVFPYSMAEALSLGLPMVVSNTFGMGEFLDDGINGYLSPVGDATATAAAITKAISSPERLAKIGAAGRELCLKELNPIKIARDTVTYFRSLGVA